jgi:PTH1 family peptidyl-tRNA hydrolase
MNIQKLPVQAIIGLGNPGPKFERTRHNIGFMVVDALAEKYGGVWQAKDLMEVAQIQVGAKQILLIKPQTYMNSSGKVIPFLTKKGIKPENILVVHDELELPLGKLKIRLAGSAKGHNGLRSIIEQIGDKFPRLSFGIDRPAQKEVVPQYVLEKFSIALQELERYIEQAVEVIELILAE